MTSPTLSYIQMLGALGRGDLTLLRQSAGRPLDHSLPVFDLFTGVWWTLRQRSEKAPRRSVAWVIAKLFAARPRRHAEGRTLAEAAARHVILHPRTGAAVERRFDEVLQTPAEFIELPLAALIGRVVPEDVPLDWVRLTDDLSGWEQPAVRLGWTERYLQVLDRPSMQGVHDAD